MVAAGFAAAFLLRDVAAAGTAATDWAVASLSAAADFTAALDAGLGAGDFLAAVLADVALVLVGLRAVVLLRGAALRVGLAFGRSKRGSSGCSP